MAYANYASITVDNTKVSGTSNLTNFPVLVSGTYDGTGGEPDLRTTGNGGNIQNTDSSGGASGSYTVPADLVFSPNTDGSSPYDFEIEFYDASTGQIVAWVEIPTLDYNDDTVFYMVYNDSSVTTSQENIAGTWGGYGTGNVFHLAGSYDGTASEVRDSLGSDHGSADQGAGTKPTQATSTGNLGYGQSNDGGDVLNHGDPTTIDNSSTLSVEFWLKMDALSTTQVFVEHHVGGGFRFSGSATNNDEFQFIILDGSGATYNRSDSANLGTGTWYHITGTWNVTGDNLVLYKDGSSTPSTQGNNLAGSTGTPSDNLSIMARWNGGSPDRNLQGDIDEVRITTNELTADWIQTNYNTQNSPSTFYTMGSETSAGGGDGSIGGLYLHTI